MRRLMSLFLALMMVFSVAAMVSADDHPLATDGWSVTNDNFLGWTKEGDEIVGDFNIGWENAEPMKLWKDMITDYNNFRLEIDLTANNMTSPAISVMGVRIETDGNGGDGHQVYLKTNNTEGFEGRNQTYDWIKAANSKAHIVIARKDGGDLHILIVGESNENVIGEHKLITVAVTNETPTVEIMAYRGCARFGNLTVTEGESVELPTEPTPPAPPATEPQPTEPAPTQPKPTDPAAPQETEPKGTEPKPTEPADSPDGGSTGLIIAIVAVVVIAVVAVVIIKKKKA